MSDRRQGSCSNPCRGVCTGILLVVWLLVAFGCVFSQMAANQLIPALKDLPANVLKGFEEVFKFADLETEAEVVKTAAEQALLKCDVPVTLCSELPDATAVGDKTSNTVEEKQQIEAAFSSTLDVVLKITTDPIFGTDALNSTAVQLRQIKDDLSSINASDAPCVATNPMYCSIWENADQITKGTDQVDAEIDKFSNTDEMKTWNDYSEYLVFMYAFPFVLVLAMLLFTIFWWKDAACVGCGGSGMGCLLLILFSVLYLVFFVISAVVCVAGYTIRNKSDEIAINGVFKTDLTLKELLDHVQTEFPAFWSMAFADLVEGLEKLNQACLIFVLACLVVMIYGFSMCLCRPYTEARKNLPTRQDGVVP